MKIAVWHNLLSGGGKRALYDHVKGLVERGHTVESWCPSTADQSYLPLGTLIQEHVRPLDAKPSPKASGPYQAHRRPFLALDEHCRRCADEINEGGFDLLFANSCHLSAAAPIGRYVTGPKLLYLQEPYRMLYEALPDLPWPAKPGRFQWKPGYLRGSLRDLLMVQARRVQAREELDSAKAFDRILVNSFFSRESLLRSYNIDASVCYLGIGTDLFQDRGLKRENMVVGVGSFSAAKNIPFVIKAVAAVSPPRPRLVWIGNGDTGGYRQELIHIAQSLGVEFEPKMRVPDDELVDLLNRAAVMLYAPRLEPFGYAPLEANACGTPVVSVAEGGVRESVQDGVNGLLVDADPFSMAAAVRELLDNPERLQRMGRAGVRQVSGRWSLDAAVDRLEHHMTGLVSPVTDGNAQSLIDTCQPAGASEERDRLSV